MNSPAADLNTREHPLILYDGVCGLCNRSVQFIIQRDPRARFRFAPLQSQLARQLLADEPEVIANELSSVILIDDGKIYRRSTAALRIAGRLNRGWPILSWLVLIPRPLRDLLYDWIARHRYRWFGKRDSCPLPNPAVANRFLA